MRADQLLVARGLSPSRTAARRAIEAGRVSYLRGSDALPVRQPAQDLPESAELSLRPDASERYVSRGGLKLAGALAHTGLDVAGLACLDVGQSTGGFTDCLLQAGAARVVGVEVGHGQLHPRLRDDPRVLCIEGVNAREGLADRLPEGPFDLVVCDASFISLTLLLAGFPPALKAGGRVLALVKPQFEVGPGNLGKGGIVRDPTLYVEVEAKIRAACADAGLQVLDFFASPITGGDGNREFFVHARSSANA
ncbi:TlyA family RNA methyltransferase [Parasulfuritortus cantonensis]|uniref:TlyA family RNA methyltransferase n=1 Tax=Parasulfuritortus cantonensis TaxID=2528202 RepID=A0A4V2NVB5_9PROT|nr:TlyA family RNA methyltransferase [Parasulfuritortus cantonensis]TCJ12826.1 TlyA family RNA methyltransferase [Parasulfuritortus cantonensis]